MRLRLLELVRCPECHDALVCTNVQQEGAYPSGEREIIEGELQCESGVHTYPVRRGIPRLLPDQLLRAEVDSHRAQDTSTPRGGLKERTLHSFSYQWNTFREMYSHWQDNFDSYFSPLVPPEEFAGRLVLDAGCGFGRHAFYAASYGAEVVGVDLSEAVEAAYANTRDKNVHVVQGDIYQLPVRPIFDLVYCVGVIQHLPDPAAGFAHLSQQLGDNGRLFVWVYGKRQGVYRLVDLMRVATTRMPLRVVHPLTYVLNLLSYGAFCVPHRILRSIPGLGWLARCIPFTRYADLPLRVGHADWFDRLAVPSTVYFTEQDVRGWYADAQLLGVEVQSRDGIGWRAIGTHSAE